MPASSPQRVLLIGWDAADWTFLTPLLDAGRMPHLSRLIETGVSGKIATLQPVLSPILWTSIATGKRGDKHGILGFVEPTPDGQGVRPVSSTSRRAKALWNLLSQEGRPSVTVNWFASHPAEVVDGAVVSDRFAVCVAGNRPLDEVAFHPPDLRPVMEQLRVDEGSLTAEQMRPFFLTRLPVHDDPRLGGLARQIAKCASVHHAATYLAEAEEWDLLAVYHDTIDHVGHGFAEYGAPRMPHVSETDFETYRHVMESTYEYHDLMLGRWLEIAGDDTLVILLSDHGFFHGEGRPLADRAQGSGERLPGVSTNPLVWHRHHGVFAARGPGIKADTLIHGATLLDVAPTILAALGLPVPEDFEGSVLRQIFEPPLEVRFCPSREEPHPQDGVRRDVSAEETDPWAAQQALAQLAELGYVEAPGADLSKQFASITEGRESHLAQIYYSTGRHEEALALLTPLAARVPDPSYRCREAMCLLALNRVDEAADLLNEVTARLPHLVLSKLLSGQVALMQGDDARAERIFQELQASESQMPTMHNMMATFYLRAERWAAAAALFERALQADPDLAEAHDGLGVAWRHLGRPEDSVYEHMHAASLLHDRPQTHINLGISLVRTKQLDWAIRAFHVAAELAPDEPYPHRCLARIYRRLRPDREKARHHLLLARDLRRKLGRAVPRFRQGV